MGLIADVDSDKVVLSGIAMIVFILAFLPHIDLIHERGHPEYAALSDNHSWKKFLTEVVVKVLRK